MTPEQAADKIYAVTGVILGTDAARHIASYLSVMEARIAELEAALRAVHRHAMTQYGIRTADQCSAALGYIDEICRAALAEEER